jgi:hypothetical protein
LFHRWKIKHQIYLAGLQFIIFFLDLW